MRKVKKNKIINEIQITYLRDNSDTSVTVLESDKSQRRHGLDPIGHGSYQRPRTLVTHPSWSSKWMTSVAQSLDGIANKTDGELLDHF